MNAQKTDRDLIEGLGGPTRVAEILGLPKQGGAQRVQNWLHRGIPAAVKVQRPDLFMPGGQTWTAPELAERQGEGQGV